MKPALLLAILVTIASQIAPAAFAVQGGPVGASGAIDGTVVIAIDGRPTPLRRARVVVKTDAASVTTDTDTDGRFHVDGLRAGTYHVDVGKFGFVSAGRIPAVVLTDGQREATTIQMVRGAAIEGRIVTEAGQPVANLVVSAARVGFGPYGRRIIAVQRATTDDLGRYRVHTLAAGEYYLEVAPDPSFMINAATISGRTRIPTRTYYTGAPVGSAKLTDARLIPVQTAQNISGADVTVVTGVAASIRARIATSSGGRPDSFSFRLQRVGGPPGEVLCFVNPGPDSEPTGTCSNVPPGEYWALASSRAAANAPPEFVSTRLSVEGRDLLDVALTAAPGAPVSGKIDVEDGAQLPPGLRVTALETEFELPGAVPGGGTSTPPVPIAADGSFAFPSLAGPRLVRVTGLPAGWAIKSIAVGNVDVVDTPTAFESIGTPAMLRVTITSRTGGVAGVVLDTAGKPAEGSRVVLFAKDSHRWGVRSRFIATTDVPPDGHYALRGVLPGEYFIVVRDVMDDGSWEDPEVLAALQPSAVSVTIVAGASATVDWRPRS